MLDKPEDLNIVQRGWAKKKAIFTHFACKKQPPRPEDDSQEARAGQLAIGASAFSLFNLFSLLSIKGRSTDPKTRRLPGAGESNITLN